MFVEEDLLAGACLFAAHGDVILSQEINEVLRDRCPERRKNHGKGREAAKGHAAHDRAQI